MDNFLNTSVVEILRIHGEDLQFTLYFSFLAIFLTLEFLIPKIENNLENKGLRLLTNYVMTIVNIIAMGLVPFSMFAVSAWAKNKGIGLLNNLDRFSTSEILLITLLARSFISWLTHILHHKIPLLWHIHRVHHTDKHLDVSSTVRFHPLEFFPSALIAAPFVAGFGLPLWALLAYELLDLVVNLFSHSNFRLPESMDRVLQLLIVTPNFHRIHHSVNQDQTDSNYGAVFTFWDYLLRTAHRETYRNTSEIRVGLDDIPDRYSQSFFALMRLPFISKRNIEK